MKKRSSHWQELINPKKDLDEVITSEETEQELEEATGTEEIVVENSSNFDEEVIELVDPESVELPSAEYMVYEDNSDEVIEDETIEEEKEESTIPEEKAEIVVENSSSYDEEVIELVDSESVELPSAEYVVYENNSDEDIDVEEVNDDETELSEIVLDNLSDEAVEEIISVEQDTNETELSGIASDEESIEVEDEIVPGVTLESLLADEDLNDTLEEIESVPSEEDLIEETKENQEEINTSKEKKESIFTKGFNILKKVVTTITKAAVLPFMGIGYFIAHPVKSTKNIFNTIIHPVATYHNLKNGNNSTNNNSEVNLDDLTAEELEEYYDKNYEYTELSLIEGEDIVKDPEVVEEEYSKSTNQEEKTTGNKSSLYEVNKTIKELTPLANIDSDKIIDLEDDAIEVISDRPLQNENNSDYILDRDNDKFTNMPIDASNISVNNGSLKLYETAENMLATNNSSTYENIEEKPYVKTKLSYL